MGNLDTFDERNPHHPNHPSLPDDSPWQAKAAAAVFLMFVAVGLGVFIGYAIWGQ